MPGDGIKYASLSRSKIVVRDLPSQMNHGAKVFSPGVGTTACCAKNTAEVWSCFLILFVTHVLEMP
jgi:hypothetical protein